MSDSHDITSTSTSTPRFDTPSPEGIARAEAAANAIPDTELVPIRADATTAASGVIGQAEGIFAHREEMVRTFGDDAAQAIDGLVPAAHHLLITNGRFQASGDRDLEPAATSLREKRRFLVLLASAVDARGVVRADVLDKLKGGLAYTALADDTQALYHWFSAHLAEVGPHCKITQPELDAIQGESLAFVGSVGIKARAGSGATAVARLRAFNHFARVYDRVRKYVTYTRWHEGDYAEIAPSIYAGRTRKDAPLVLAPPNDIPPGMPGASPFERNP